MYPWTRDYCRCSYRTCLLIALQQHWQAALLISHLIDLHDLAGLQGAFRPSQSQDGWPHARNHTGGAGAVFSRHFTCQFIQRGSITHSG